MKWLSASLFILMTVLSCSDDGFSPKQRQLFKTWVRTQSLLDGRDVTPDKAYAFRIEFRPDGQLLYGTAKASGGCCTPSRFTVDDRLITFIIDASNPALHCANSSCNPSELLIDVRWRIESLSDSQLKLTAGTRTLLFEPVQ